MTTTTPVKRYRKLPRNILTIMVTFIAGMSVIMIYYRFGTNPQSLRAQKKEEKEQKQIASEQPGDPVAMRKLLEEAAQRVREEKAKHPNQTTDAAGSGASVTNGGSNANPAQGGTRMPPGTPGDPSFSVDNYEAAKLQVQKSLPEQKKDESKTLAAFEFEQKDGSPASTGNSTLDGLLSQLGKGTQNTGSPTGIDMSTIQRLLAQAQGGGTAAKAPVRANEDWLNKQSESNEEAPLHAKPPLGPYALYYGTWIPCDLMYAVDSDLPGDVSCQVTKDVYGIGSNPYLLIPQYSVLHGKYNIDIANGQERMLMAFRRLNYPSGAHVDLTAMTGSDSSGRAGAAADVNNHFWKIFGSSFLISGAAILASRNEPSSGTTVTVNGGPPSNLSGAAGQVMVDTVQKILERNTTIKPTLQNDPFKDKDGISRLMVFVNHDMILDPAITQPKNR